MAVLDIKYLLLLLLEQKNISDIRFDNNILGFATNELMNGYTSASASPVGSDQYKLDVVTSIRTCCAQKIPHTYTDAVEEISTKLAEDIQNVLSLMSESVKPTVTSLFQQIVAAREEFITTRYGNIDLNNNSDLLPAVTISPINWYDCSNASCVTVARSLLERTNGTEADDINIGSKYSIFLNKASNVAQTAENIDLSSTIGQVTEKIMSNHPGLFGPHELQLSLGILANPATFLTGFLNDFRKISRSEIGRRLALMSNVLPTLVTMIVSDEHDCVPAEIKAVIERNYSGCIGEAISWIAAAAIAFRKLVSNNVVLDIHTYNPDALDGVVGDTPEEKRQNIQNFLYYRQTIGTSNSQETDAYDAQTVNAQTPAVQKYLEGTVKKRIAERAVVIDSAYNYTIPRVLTAFVKQFIGNRDDALAAVSLRNHRWALEHIESFSVRDDALEDVLYDYVIQVCHHNTIMLPFYQRLKMNILSEVRTAEEIEIPDGERILKAHYATIADITAEFLVTKLCL